MRIVLTLLCLVVPLAAAAQAVRDPAPDAPTPRTYALVAAVSEGFHLVVEKMSTGSHLAPYVRRRSEEASDGVNLMVVRELARQVAVHDPGSRSVLMVFPMSLVPETTAAERPQATFDAVAAELKKAPDRAAWDRILIVTPAFRASGREGMATQLEGMGLFIEPLCVSDQTSCENFVPSLSGPTAQRADGKVAPTNSFFAPYFYATLWELDAATMEVIAKREVFQQQRMSSGNELLPAQVDAPERARIVAQLTTLVNQSIHEALKKTDLAGHVEVVPLKEAEPDN